MSNPNSRGSLLAGLALVGLGVLFLLQQFFSFNFWDTLWPFLVLGAGAVMLALAWLGGRDNAPLFVPGSIVSMVGLILFVLNLTHRWEAWSYAWTLIVAAVGAGLWAQGWRLGNAGLQRRGRQTLLTGLGLLVAFGAFFELVIFGSARVARWAGPALLIALGGFLLLRGLLGRRAPAANLETERERQDGISST